VKKKIGAYSRKINAPINAESGGAVKKKSPTKEMKGVGLKSPGGGIGGRKQAAESNAIEGVKGVKKHDREEKKIESRISKPYEASSDWGAKAEHGVEAGTRQMKSSSPPRQFKESRNVQNS